MTNLFPRINSSNLPTATYAGTVPFYLFFVLQCIMNLSGGSFIGFFGPLGILYRAVIARPYRKLVVLTQLL
jgi:hypothetical protein